MFWNQPHISKIYEALGAIADDRIEFITNINEAKVYSSSKNKFYTVLWSDDFTQMMSNDSSAFWQNKLSYPMIAVLMLKNKINYSTELLKYLKDINWKELNTKFKNNYDKTIEFVLSEFEVSEVNFIKSEISKIEDQVKKMKIEPLGKKLRVAK